MGEQIALPEDELETFRQLRHRCPHCRKSFASRTYARQHISTMCQMRGANHGCKTCANFEEAEPANYSEGYPGSRRGCGVGVDLSDGILSIHCPKWERYTDA